MRSQLENYVDQLIAGEHYDNEVGVWLFENGSQCGVCTSAAILVAETYFGSVWGYSARDNPTALIGGSRFPCEGHDFALIQERWVVDYWANRVAQVSPKPVLDLNQLRDRRLASSLYGASQYWKRVASFETQAITLRTPIRDDRPRIPSPVRQVYRAGE